MPEQNTLQTIDAIRAVSRQLVRELGFMGDKLAGSGLSPSAVHALIEIEAGGVTAGDLGVLLHLEKSSVSRMLRKLIEANDVAEQARQVGRDGRVKILSLTAQGKRRVTAIHKMARAQVSDALSCLQLAQQRTVLDGLGLYVSALASQTDAQPVVSQVEIVKGYQTGLIARITELHARYYARASGFGQRFEAVVAGELAKFCGRLDRPGNAIWAAMMDNEITGSIAIDGDDMGSDLAHLRWFIVNDTVRGTGAGRRLLSTALDFVDAQGFKETHLWTFSDLSAARHLYEAYGFTLEEERPGTQWGKEVLEQRFVRRIK